MKSVTIPLDFLKAIGEKPHAIRLYWIKWLADYSEELFRPDFCEFFQSEMLGKNIKLETIKEAYDSGIGFFKDGILISENKKSKKEYRQETMELAEKVLDYLNAKANTSYTSKSKATMEVISARQRDGYTITDFKTVIDNKVVEWLGTEQQSYLRPITLFGNKFENYLNQIQTPIKNEPTKQSSISKINDASSKAKQYVSKILSK